MRKAISLIAAVALICVVVATAAYATRPIVSHMVTICHATPPDTAANGWVSITVDVASVGYMQSGHQDEHDADIIPPYSHGDFVYPGKGDQSILANGCVAPEEPPTCEEDPQQEGCEEPEDPETRFVCTADDVIIEIPAEDYLENPLFDHETTPPNDPTGHCSGGPEDPDDPGYERTRVPFKFDGGSSSHTPAGEVPHTT